MNVQQLEKTLYASLYAQQIYEKNKEKIHLDCLKYPFEQHLKTYDIQQYVTELCFGCTTEIEFMRALRIARACLMFRWIWQDANQLIDVVTLTRELSDFSDICIEVAKQFARQPLVEKYGEPISHAGEIQDLIVIAMGKLGAQELNLSSDIDLIFAFDEQGQTNGKKSIDVQQFCILWGQKLIYLLDQVTADGFVFRVDMRLRPWGDGSALVVSYASLEKYLIQHGREWERYAWIKARIVSGSEQGNLLLKMTRPFVFRRYVDYSAFSAMREMKQMIEREVVRRGLKDDIKLGAGGIREIEFIVQVFQLIYGGSKRELQDRQCLVNLQHLAHIGLLDTEVVVKLTNAYLFLRRLEHAIQALNDQQTQALPCDENLQQRITDTLGFTSWRNLLEVLDEHRNAVSQQFKQLIQENEIVEPEQCQQNDLVEQFNDESQQKIAMFWASSAVRKLPAKALERLHAFWDLFIVAILKAQQPEVALSRLMPLVESVMRRTVYLVMLTENAGALQRLVKMAEVSSWICEELTQYPVLLDEFLSMDFVLPNRRDLKNSMHHQLLRIEIDQVEDLLRALRLFKKSHVLAVAASDVLAESPLMKVSDALTDIAEVCVETTLNWAYRLVAQRHGFPLLKNGERCSLVQQGFIVIAYGKLGGIELGYGSDLDLVFLHDLKEQHDTDGLKPITGFEFALKVAQKFMSLMTMQTLDGRVYEVDTRLRPSGEAGVLVTSLSAYSLYQQKSAWLWEHQALVRARVVAGDTDLKQQFDDVRQQVLTQVRVDADVQKEVLKMREKMKTHLGSNAEQKKLGLFHLKQDTGGIVDIEFMAQYIVLAWSAENPNLAYYSDNVRILEAAAQAGCLSSNDVQALIQAYLRERATSHRLALANQNMQVQASVWQNTREIVYKLWQKLIDPSLTLDSEK